MIQSIQKIIKIGTSGGVTIPAKEMKRQNLSFGDQVQITVKPLSKAVEKQEKLLGEYDSFKEQYGQTLKNLADR